MSAADELREGREPVPVGADGIESGYRSMRLVRLEGFEEAVALAKDERDAYRRRFTTLFIEDGRERRGGFGRVTHATNARGEALALKSLIIPERGADEDDAGYRERVARLERAFRQEYEDHRALAGLRGFPRLYGYGTIEGVPAIVMEWVEGVTLEAARRELAVDDAGRMSPLSAARIGCALFGLLAHMDQVGGGFVHRDISPANIMVRTARLGVAEQAEEGAFDLCLVDFGSAALLEPEERTSFTMGEATVRMATAAYAPPEMLTRDLPHLDRLRKSPAIDVYEAASVVYELLCGRTPFDLGSNEAPGDGGADGNAPHAAENRSPYRIKMDLKPRPVCTAHGAQDRSELSDVLVREPEVAVAAGRVALDLKLEPSSPRVTDALALVDEQLAELLLPCLAPSQGKRPSAQAMYDGLLSFCTHYTENIGRALRGEALIPCMGSTSWLDAASPFAVRRLVRTFGKAVAGAVFIVVVAATAILVDGAPAVLRMGPVIWEGRLGILAVAGALVLPAAGAYVVRGGRTGTRAGFVSSTFVLVCLTFLVAAAISCLVMEQPERTRGLYAALLAAESAAWCPIVLDYAMTVVPSLIAEARRRLAGGSRAAIASARPAPVEAAGQRLLAADEAEGEGSHE